MSSPVTVWLIGLVLGTILGGTAHIHFAHAEASAQLQGAQNEWQTFCKGLSKQDRVQEAEAIAPTAITAFAELKEKYQMGSSALLSFPSFSFLQVQKKPPLFWSGG